MCDQKYTNGGLKASLLATVAMLAAPMAAPMAALAQTTTPASTRQLQEVVVTAERRSTNIQKEPIAITAITATQLAQQGVTSGTDIVGVVPGVKISTERGSAMFFIRGIGSVGANPYTNPDVTYNVDGQTYALPTGPNGSLFDVARVEVLKGPQGTLYGANAAAGAINVISNDPVDHYAAAAELKTGNYGLFQGNGMINVPVTDTLAVRAAFQAVEHGPYIRGNGTDNADDAAGRIKALYKPSSDLKVLIEADYSHQGGAGSQRVPLNANGSYYFGAPWVVQRDFPVTGGEVQLLQPGVTTDHRNDGVSAQIDYNLGFATATLIPGYRDMVQHDFTCDLGFCFQQNEDDKAENLEARLTSNANSGSPLKWVAGLYGRHDSLPNSVNVQQSFPLVGSGIPEGTQQTFTPKDNAESLAVFAQGTYSILNWLRATAGIRYNHDQKEEHGYTVNDNPNGAPPGVGTYDTDYAVKSDRPTFRVGLDADVAPNSIVFGNVSTGYKEGGFGAAPNPGPGVPPNPYATYLPEQIIAWDVGTKNTFLDHRLQVNAELFYWIYYNQQINAIVLVPQNVLGVAIVPNSENAGHGDDKGVDIDAAFLATANDRLTASIEYLDTRYNSFNYQFLFSVDNNTGRPFNYAPKLSANLGYTHTFPFNSGATLDFSVNTHVTTGYWVDYNYMPNTGWQPGYHKTDLDLNYTSPDGKWYAGAWVKNLEDVATKSFTGGDLPGSPNLQWTELDAPRTYGVTMGAKF